ncbi:polysaccharide lyase family 7 protein [Psychromonas sp.]|nr:polysaccharide lyase family 7 protein [Psychromonas sp.]
MTKSTVKKSIAIALTLSSIGAFADTAPYNYENSSGETIFQDALAEVKLTSPDGSTILAEGSEFDGYVTDNFKVPTGDNYMQITHEGVSSSRTEFRHLTDFSTNDSNTMQGTIKVASTTSGLDEVTVLQIHNSDSENIGAPLMRIAQIVEDGTKFYEAKFRLSACNKSLDTCDPDYDTYRWLDTNNEPTVLTTDHIEFYVRVKDGVVKALMGGVHGTLMCEENNVYSADNCSTSDKSHTTSSGNHEIDSDWPTTDFYFKTGAYIQDAGTAVVRYKSLTFNVTAQ